MDKKEILSVLAGLDLSITSTFVPFSQSRNKEAEFTSLNWKVTLLKAGKEVLTTDYMAGNAHCPAYNNPDEPARQHMIDFECENGYKAKWITWGREPRVSGLHKEKLLPDFCDFMYSMAMDSDVLESASFEEWAENFGYSTDSREAERIYNACLKTALALRVAIGEKGLETLREAFQDY